jgi:ribosome-binding ATPase YchF (GTP1/OBG family)
MLGQLPLQAAEDDSYRLRKGFIRAVIATKTFSTVQKQNVKKQESSVEGKEYVVKDGDVMHFRFNV